MNAKYVKVKKVVIPFLTLVILVSQFTGCSSLKKEDIAEINNDSPEVVIEYAEPADEITVIELEEPIEEVEPSESFPDEHPVITWEEPPVVTYYNEDADTNNDGHVDKQEWEKWVEAHPEDLNQDMVLDDAEKKAYEDSQNPTTPVQPIQPSQPDYTPTPAENVNNTPSEEQKQKEQEENKEMWEAEGQGLAGLTQWAEDHSDSEDWEPESALGEG